MIFRVLKCEAITLLILAKNLTRFGGKYGKSAQSFPFSLFCRFSYFFKKQKTCRFLQVLTSNERLDGAVDFVAAYASCAYVLSRNCSVLFNFYSLNVCIPFSSGMPVGMGNVVSGYLALTTYFTLS